MGGLLAAANGHRAAGCGSVRLSSAVRPLWLLRGHTFHYKVPSCLQPGTEAPPTASLPPDASSWGSLRHPSLLPTADLRPRAGSGKRLQGQGSDLGDGAAVLFWDIPGQCEFSRGPRLPGCRSGLFGTSSLRTLSRRLPEVRF